jgi:hypothetical protein
VGDTVTWDTGASPTHNVKATNDVPADPDWKNFLRPGPTDFTPASAHSRFEYTFEAPGVYTFQCMLHFTTMAGTVTVTEPGSTPTATATATATSTATATATATTQPPRPTASATATPDTHTNTPPPSPGADTTKPRISSASVKGLRRAVRVRFRLSETSTVTIQIKKQGSRKVLRTQRINARAGVRTVTVRSSKLRRGRYTVELRARDAMGNRSTLAKKSVRLRR